jgi:2-dehydro-3-deoxy-D-arabinonate dehydratase
VKTIRYLDPARGTAELGLLIADEVYSITNVVPQWTDPIGMWYALQALGVNPEDVTARFTNQPSKSYRELEQSHLLLPPVHAEEVWAAGVTYERSRQARNAETRISDSVYDRVYDAVRPELFFKATAKRVVAPGQPLRLRTDSEWMVPEPELAVVLSAGGDIIGYTVANDLSSRDIEGENPLYLPQAKVFLQSCSFGPVLLWNTAAAGNPAEWTIELDILRDEATAFKDAVSFSQFRRSFGHLIDYLRKDNPIPDGTVLMTGTGIVPPDEFTLRPLDTVSIRISSIGTLTNPIE